MAFKRINSVFFKKRKLFIRLSFFLLTVFVFLILYIANYGYLRNEMRVTENYQAEQVRVKFEYYFKNITSAANFDSNNVLLPVGDIKPEDVNGIQRLINSVRVTYGGVEAVSLSNGENTFGEPKLLNETNQPSIGKYNSCDFYINSDENWSRKLYIKCEGSLNDTVIGINLIECLREMYPNNASFNKDVMLITNDGTVLAFSDRSCIGKNLSTLLREDWKNSYSDFITAKLNDTGFYVTAKKLSKTGLSIVFLSPKTAYMSLITSQTIKAVIYCTLLMSAFGVLFAVVMHRVNEQMKILSQKIEETNIVKRSDFSSDVEFLEHGLIGFSEKLSGLQAELGAKVENLRKAQITALQLQINPHFLFNTIDSINWKAAEILGVNNEISKSLINLSNIFSYSMDINIISVPLKDEIDITEKYLELINVRCCAQINVIWDIDPELKDAFVPRLSLQPLIENAVTHGFLQNIDENSLIKISAKRKDKEMLLSVEDNGLGLGKEQLAELNSSIKAVSEAASKHIGLRNINSRLRLLYGDKYGLKLCSGQNGGTLCEMIMPIVKKEKREYK